MKRLFTLLILSGSIVSVQAQKLEKLTVETIMRDPKWMGTQPTGVSWSEDSKKIFFSWNPDNAARDGVYSITPEDIKPKVATAEERRAATTPTVLGNWNSKHTMRLIDKGGDIYIVDGKTKKETQLTATVDRETNAVFSADDSKVIFAKGENYYSIQLNGGLLSQLTNFTHSTATGTTPTPAPALFAGGAGGGRGGRGGGGQGGGGRGAGGGAATQQAGNEQERWLRAEQLALFDVLKERQANAGGGGGQGGGGGRGGRGGFGGGGFGGGGG